MVSINKKLCLKIIDIILMLIIVSILLWCGKLAVRIFCFDTFVIPSHSMEPTLIPGDKIIVNKILYGARIYRDFNFSRDGVTLQSFRTNGLRDIQRGDIVVFNMPYHDGCDTMKFIINYVYCKRCIGQPGDSVSIRNGYYINDNTPDTLGCKEMQSMLAQTPDSLLGNIMPTMPYDNHMAQWTIKDFGPLYIPRRGDRIDITPTTATLYRQLIEWERHCRLTIDWRHNRVFAGRHPISRHTFTHDYFFMAGDNAPDSRDSRYIGLIPDDYIIGIATRIKYSRDRGTGELQWNRILKKL